MEIQKCYTCKESKKINDFYKNQKRCKKCSNEAVKKWVEKNKDKTNRYKKNYRDNNKESQSLYQKNKVRDYKKENIARKNKRANDPVFKFNTNIQNSIRRAFKNHNSKKCKRTVEILGCSLEEFRLYISKKFEYWMNWNNNGIYRKDFKTWQLDHIIPISSAKTIEDIIKLNHFTNFQPLESLENIKKSNKI